MDILVTPYLPLLILIIIECPIPLPDFNVFFFFYSPSKKSNVKEVQLMYIQMEFCDNQTLRSAIDKGLYKDTKRVWKMFREIIEGLLHIHR